MEENRAFRSAYAMAVPEKKVQRRILVEAADADSDKTFFDPNSSVFKDAMKLVPRELVDLIYQQLKISPKRLVEVAENQQVADDTAVDIADDQSQSSFDAGSDDVGDSDDD